MPKAVTKLRRKRISEESALAKINDGILENLPDLRNLPTRIQNPLSGLGEPPQFGNVVTLADIQQAFRTSERGEPYYMFALNRDMIINDPHIQAEIGKRIMSFMGQNESIEPWNKSDQDDKVAQETIEDMIYNCENWREGCLHLANGHIWPIAGAEKIYAEVTPEIKKRFRHPVKWYLKKLHPIPWPLFTYKVAYWNVNMADQWRPGGGLTPRGVLTNTGAMPIQDTQEHTALDGQWMQQNNNQVLIWNPEDWHADLRFYSTFSNGLIDWTMAKCYKPDKVRHVLHSASVSTAAPIRENFGGLLRSLIPLWFFSTNGRDWFARAMERYGSPFAIANANTANKNIFDLLTKAFNQATKVNALIVPPGAKIELKEIQASGMADGYSKFIEILNTEKTKAILGQTLSTTSKGSGMMGGSGVADLHSEVRSEWTQYDKRAFSGMLQDQIFQHFLAVNGYSGRCKSVRGGITPANQKLLASTLKDLAAAGIAVSKESEQDLSSTFGVRLEIKDIPLLQPKNGNEEN